ncbi:MAG: GNAT family protein [Verrucomicrobiota bacterium]
MTTGIRENKYGQQIGFELGGWQEPNIPPHATLTGRHCRLEPLDAQTHASELFAAFNEDALWTYLAYGPFDSAESYASWIDGNTAGKDPLFYAIVDSKTRIAVGVASFLRIKPNEGVIEVGHIVFSPQLRRTPAATESMYLMMRHIFDDLGYRRYEWKCDALNAASRRAAERLGFTSEGVFRQATVYKGRNRDTAWYSILDREWPDRKKAFEAWLNPTNFDENDKQRQRLKELPKS